MTNEEKLIEAIEEALHSLDSGYVDDAVYTLKEMLDEVSEDK